MNTRGIAAIIAAALIIVAGAIFFVSRDRNDGEKPASSQNPPSSQEETQGAPGGAQESAANPPTRALEIALNAQNSSGETGKAELTEIDGKTKVELDLSGAPQNIVQPAHIHTGSCANLGGVKYPLTFPVNGKSETTLNVSISQILSELPLAVNVHKSAAEASVYVSCGDIGNPDSDSAQSAAPPAGPAPAQKVEDRPAEGGPFSTPTDKRKGADKPED